MPTSRYTLFVDNLSSSTRSADIRYEMESAGRIIEVVRDPKTRSALVEFDRADDAEWAWKKLDRIRVDGREWRIEWANDRDFEHFDKKWTEGGNSGSKGRRSSRSRSRSRSKSPHPTTPRDEERRPRSPSAKQETGGRHHDHRERDDGYGYDRDHHRDDRRGTRSPSPRD